MAAFQFQKVWQGQPHFYQKYHGAAVMIALGEGFANPTDKNITAFLQLQTDKLDTNALPLEIPRTDPTPFQENHRYAQYLIGWWWRLAGISWTALIPLKALLYSLLIILCYGLIRLCAPKPLAFAGALLLAYSPEYLLSMPHFRDFSKAPFIMALLLLLGLLLIKGRSRKIQYLLSALMGLCLGIGLGFRQDLLAFLPPAAFLILVFFPGSIRTTWGRRLTCAILLIVTFLIASAPILMAVQRHAADSFHHINQGVNTPFNKNMGLGGAAYSQGYLYRDEYTHSIVSAWAMQHHGATSELPAYVSNAYDEASRAWYMQVYLRHFPADFTTRWFAAIRRVLNYSPFAMDMSWPVETGTPAADRIFEWRCHLLKPLIGMGSGLTLLALLLLSLRSLRLAGAAAFILFFWGGYVSLQFMVRHYFYLEVFFWWSLAFLITALIRLPIKYGRPAILREAWRRCRTEKRWFPAPLLRLSAAAATLSAALILFPAAARLYQERHLTGILDEYRQAPLERLDVEIRRESGTVILPENFPDEEGITGLEEAMKVEPAMLVLDFEAADIPIPVNFIYTAEKSENNLSTMMRVPPGKGNRVRIWFPVYNTPSSYFLGERRFQGIRIPEMFSANFKGMYQLPHPEKLPFMMHLRLVNDAPDGGLYLSRQPDLIPPSIRAFQAYSDNLLLNGGFESWLEDGSAPENGMPPNPLFSGIFHSDRAASGSSAVRQVWLKTDAGAGLMARFFMMYDEEVRGGEYEFFGRVLNQSTHTAVISAWQVIEDENGRPLFIQLNPQLCLIPPGSEYRTCFGVFYSRPAEKRSSIALATGILGADSPEGAVYWDDWRLVRR